LLCTSCTVANFSNFNVFVGVRRNFPFPGFSADDITEVTEVLQQKEGYVATPAGIVGPVGNMALVFLTFFSDRED